MKRYLWLMCIGCCSATFAVACGDDDGGGPGGMEDGGVTIDDKIDNLSDQLGGLEGDLGDLESTVNMGLDDLNTGLEGANADIGGLQGDVEDLQGQIEDLITPDNCSAEELCVPDGVQATAAALVSLMTTLCEQEFDCCDEDERAVRLGAGVADVGDCVKRFVDMLENGQSPDLDLSWANDEVLNDAVQIAIAINSGDVQVGVDADAIAACEDSIADLGCNGDPEEVGEEPAHCETADYEEEVDPCSADAIVIGLQQEGELCGVTGVNECAAGLRCRFSKSLFGICMPPSAVDDACATDADCDGEEQYCDPETNTCAERGDAGDPCGYVDDSFLVTSYDFDLDPQWEGWAQNPGALNVECKTGLWCDPIDEVCVENCSEHALCWGNWGCPEDMICNFTEVPNLWQTWSLGLCTAPLEEGDECTQTTAPLPNGEYPSTECDTERCDDIGSGPECVDARTEDGGDCEVSDPGLDASCASSWCDRDEACAALCDLQADCPNDAFCDWYNDSVLPGGLDPCEPKGGTDDDCDAMIDENIDNAFGTDVGCTSGRCDTNTGLCAAKLAAGDTCTHHADCPSGQFCGYDPTDTPSPGYECMAFVATDADCSTPDAGDWGCGPDARCIGGVCKDEGDAGESCEGNPYCQGYPIAMTCAFISDDDDECHYGGDFPEGADCAPDVIAPDESGGSPFGDGLCADGWCGPSYTCLTPIAADEDCDADDPSANRCEAGYYCKHDPDAEGDDIGKGKCTKQRSTGQGCEPRYDQYGGGTLNVHDCQGEDDSYPGSSNRCILVGGDFVCDQYSNEDAPMCDGEG